jgi:hypothetical protein
LDVDLLVLTVGQNHHDITKVAIVFFIAINIAVSVVYPGEKVPFLSFGSRLVA